MSRGTSSRRTLSFLLMLFFFFSGLDLFAQENDDETLPDVGSEWMDIVSEPYSRGDTNFIITLGVLIPAYFSGIENNNHKGKLFQTPAMMGINPKPQLSWLSRQLPAE